MWPEFRDRVVQHENAVAAVRLKEAKEKSAKRRERLATGGAAEDGEEERRDSELYEDAQWAFENHSDEAVLPEDAPSNGAASMLLMAREDFGKFIVLHKDLKKQRQSVGDGERIVRQWTDKQKETIRGQLAKISKAAEELVLP